MPAKFANDTELEQKAKMTENRNRVQNGLDRDLDQNKTTSKGKKITITEKNIEVYIHTGKIR